MHAPFRILILFTLFSCGCSEIICNSGFDLNSLSTQSAVRSKFGQPLNCGKQIDDPEIGRTYDEYITHLKLAHNQGMYGMAVAMTFGTCELFAFPWQTLVASQNIILGRRIRYIYDQDGNVVRVLEEAEYYMGPIRIHSGTE